MIFARLATSVVCLVAVAALATGWTQSAGDWRVEGSRKAPPFRLIHSNISSSVSYIFDCSGPKLLVTETGVTKLLDLKAGGNTRVPDAGEGRIMPDGSAALAIATDTGEPEFTFGTAQPNPSSGWDITIELPRRDKSFERLGRAKFVSLFSTGFTALVGIEDADRKVVSDFVKECRK